MADLSKTIEIIFGATDKTGSGLSSISSSINNAVSSISSVTAPLASVADSAIKAETAILGLAAAYGGYAMIKASEFETAQIDLNKVLSDSDPKIESFTKTVIDLSEQYGISSASILQGISNFKQAGFTAEESALLQKNALDLVIAGDIDAANASEILVQSLKGFNISASEAPRFIEALNNVSNDYATDVKQLAEGMSRVAPIAEIMGFSFEETAGVLTPMIEKFGSGAFAAEAFKTGLLKLIDDTKPVKDALASINVSQTDLNGNLRSGKDIFYDVSEAFKTLDQNQKLFVASQLIGIDQAPRMISAFNDLALVNKITASAMEVTGSVAKEVELRLDSTAKVVDIFKTSFDNLAISIGTKLNDNFSGVVTGATSVEQALRKIVESGGLDKFFEALKPQLQSFADTLTNVAKNLPDALNNVDTSKLIAALQGLGKEIGGVFSGLDLNTTKGLSNAIQFVVDSFESLTKVVTGIVGSWDTFVNKAKDLIQVFNELSSEDKKNFGSKLGIAQQFETLKGIFETGASAVQLFAGAMAVLTTTNLLSGVAALQVSLVAAGAALLPLIEVAGALTALKFGYDQISVAYADLKNRQDIMNNDSQHTIELQGRMAERFDDIGKRTGVYVTNMFELNRAVDNGILVMSDITNRYEKGGEALTTMSTAFEPVIAKTVKLDDATIAAADGLAKFSESAKIVQSATNEMSVWFSDAAKAEEAYTRLIESGQKATIEYANGLLKVTAARNDDASARKDMVKDHADITLSFADGAKAQESYQRLQAEGHKVNIEYKDGLFRVSEENIHVAKTTKELADEANKAALKANEGSKEWKTVQDVMIETQQVTDDFKVKMGELANKRYEIDVKANVDLKVAEIEADTARIGQAYKGITDVIAALAPQNASLWETFGKQAGFTGADQIQKAAEESSRQIQTELDMKKELTDATIEKMRAETERLTSGEALIQINAGDLAPELELVFDKILKYTQIKATQQGLAMLVGI